MHLLPRRIPAVAGLVLAVLLPLAGCGGDAGSAERAPGDAPGDAAGLIPGGPFARAELLADARGLVPGETVDLGVRLVIDEGWHLYWNGRNDTGLPPGAEVTLPAGYAAGDLRWPAPHRKVSPGGILDHVYEEEVVLLLPVTAPADARPGDTVDLAVALDWLVCREACIAESDTLHLTLPVTDGRSAPRTGAAVRLAEVRRSLPVPAPEGLAAWEGSSLVVRVPRADGLAFYPSSDAPEAVSLLEDGATDGDRLVIRFIPEDLDRPVTGVLRVRHPDHDPGVYELRVPPPNESRG